MRSGEKGTGLARAPQPGGRSAPCSARPQAGVTVTKTTGQSLKDHMAEPCFTKRELRDANRYYVKRDSVVEHLGQVRLSELRTLHVLKTRWLVRACWLCNQSDLRPQPVSAFFAFRDVWENVLSPLGLVLVCSMGVIITSLAIFRVSRTQGNDRQETAPQYVRVCEQEHPSRVGSATRSLCTGCFRL